MNTSIFFFLGNGSGTENGEPNEIDEGLFFPDPPPQPPQPPTRNKIIL